MRWSRFSELGDRADGGIFSRPIAPADVEFLPHRLLEPVVFVVPGSPDGPRPRSYADAKRLLLGIEVLSP